MNYVSEALEHAPSLIVFDDLDSIILSTSESEGSQLSASMSAITEFLIDMIDEYEVITLFVVSMFICVQYNCIKLEFT